MQTVTVDDELAAIQRAESGSLEGAAREALVVELFRRGRVSIVCFCSIDRCTVAESQHICHVSTRVGVTPGARH